MIYQDWGFSRSPFQQTSLPPDELGSSLLVGRDEQVNTLIRRIEGAPKIAILEGLNGIGKTSVVNVAAYRLFEKYKTGAGPLFIPCRKSFQLHPEGDVEAFTDNVLIEVAQTLIDHLDLIEVSFDGSHLRSIDKWINSPEIKSYSVGLGPIAGGMNVNANPTFERTGLRQAITSVLEQLFPSDELGGVVCCIDNLELLQESSKARQVLEQLRDGLLQARGLCWVLCGALGITYGVASSPRLDGYLHRPIELKEMDKSFAPTILKSRITAFALKEEPYLPIVQEDFDRLYTIVRGNLRTILSYTDNYCQAVADGKLPVADEEKNARFSKWLLDESREYYETAKSSLTPRTLRVFLEATKGDGTFSPGDHETFGFTSMAAFRPYIKSLEDVSLVVSTQDDTDKRRKTIQVTAKGWLTNYYISTVVNRTDRATVDEPPF